MMKLYLANGACSLADHIALHEAGLDFGRVTVDLRSKRTADGVDYTTVNPKGYVPTLVLDDGTVLTENIAILDWIAERCPRLAPSGAHARSKLLEMLAFISTEIHKQFSPLWHPAPEETKASQRKKIASRLDLVSKTLATQPYLTGEQFTIADAYLFTILNWAPMLKFDLAPWPALQKSQARVAVRPAVHAALVAEGLVRETATA